MLTAPVWDTSWLLADGSLPGRLLHTLIGYTDQPSGAQLIVYGLTIAVVVALMRLVGGRKPAAAMAAP
jgi:high-affinity iron transporter